MAHPRTLPARTARRRAGLAALVLVVALAVGGCASVNHLRDAQDAFNSAAAADNDQRLTAAPDDAVTALSSARSGYASALLSLDKLETGDADSLRRDGLWGTALTLRALCQWRLGQYSEAMATAAEAQRATPEQIYPRDRAVLAALPGLIKTDQAYARIMAGPAGADATRLADIRELLVGPRGAIADLQAARAMTDANHPVQVYLVQAQLAAYRNYLVARDRFMVPRVPLTTEPERAEANAQLTELDRLVRLADSGSAATDLVNYWVRVCGLKPPGT